MAALQMSGRAAGVSTLPACMHIELHELSNLNAHSSYLLIISYQHLQQGLVLFGCHEILEGFVTMFVVEAGGLKYREPGAGGQVSDNLKYIKIKKVPCRN